MAEDLSVSANDLVVTARRWLDGEPDSDIRDELAALIERAESGDVDALAERFDGSLQFGTAGLRAAVGAGSMRMNRLVVRRAAAGLGRWLLAEEAAGRLPDAARRGVVIAHDARRKSDLFAVDTARVLAAMGIRSMLHPGVQPTPVLAWSITGIGAAAGVVVTASHNPPADNGYKVYLQTGSQIVTPIDVEIAGHIAAYDDPTTVDVAAEDHPLIERLDSTWVDRYVDFAPSVRLRPDVVGVPVAYTAMHGVGGAAVLRAFEAAGFPAPHVVDAQQEPDGTFPTVAFPNPEEPGAMDLLLDVARQVGAQVALANDPDADRLGVAIPQPDGSWRRLAGDEIGWLFADYIISNTSGDDRLVVTTLVSSSLLARMAEAAGIHSEETFTGFKYIGQIATERPEQRLMLGYEQALGYLVAQRPLDKDGITAAILMAEIAAVAAADGETLQDRLDSIAARFGQYVTSELSVRIPPVVGARWVAAIEAEPPSEIGGRAVESVQSYPEANLVRLMLDGGVRLQVRPSGTEPKVKLYGEAVDLPRADLDALLADLATLAPM
ncbi:MAG: phospho-sugar mutase [Ilumatobacteraceae bacterium]